MLKLSANAAPVEGQLKLEQPIFARVTMNPNYPRPLRAQAAFLYEGQCEQLPEGFLLALRRPGAEPQLSGTSPALELSPDQYFIGEGDVIRVTPRLRVTALYRRSASTNALLVTEQCNSFCVMCSQPPKAHDDSHLIDQITEAIPLIGRECRELVITGGEPTLLGEKFFRLVRTVKSFLPSTSIHVLTNGRTFKDPALAKTLASIAHPDLMLGIPLYSDVASLHDFVVQADGAFDETIAGILNLKRFGQRVELRVVIHAQTYKRLPQLADFIVRNLQFVDQVSLMGLEPTGFALANLAEMWIDPFDYQDALERAVRVLDQGKVKTLIFNHQLCVLKRSLWPFAVKSISDWKREYVPECEGCPAAHGECGGFFSSSLRQYSSHIRPLEPIERG